MTLIMGHIFDIKPILASVIAQAPPASNPLTMIGMILLFLALMYFMIILPQSRQQKERKKMLDSAGKGSRVIFSGGIYGTIVGEKKTAEGEVGRFVVKVNDDGAKLEILREAITSVVDSGKS